MPEVKITSRHIGPALLAEHFFAEHFFLYVASGALTAYNGQQEQCINTGNYCIARKNYLGRFSAAKGSGPVNQVVVVFDAALLEKFRQRQPIETGSIVSPGAFVMGGNNAMVEMYVNGLAPYYTNGNTLDQRFADLKREELLMILLHVNPDLVGTLFTEVVPERTDLQTFMNKNFRFNAGVERFAFLTGRSLSGFKRDFQKTFNDTPTSWLVRRRLEEAHFLISKTGQKPIDIYKDLGFEDLSHFSFAFKKQYGIAPKAVPKLALKRRN